MGEALVGEAVLGEALVGETVLGEVGSPLMFVIVQDFVVGGASGVSTSWWSFWRGRSGLRSPPPPVSFRPPRWPSLERSSPSAMGGHFAVAFLVGERVLGVRLLGGPAFLVVSIAEVFSGLRSIRHVDQGVGWSCSTEEGLVAAEVASGDGRASPRWPDLSGRPPPASPLVVSGA